MTLTIGLGIAGIAWIVVLVLILVLAIGMLVAQLPEIRRYKKMSSM